MRDKIKDRSYFDSYISELDEMIELNQSSLESGSIPEGRVLWVKMNTFNYQLNKVVAMYSSRYSIDEMSQLFVKAIKGYFTEAWVQKSTKVHIGSDRYIDQYTIEPYGKMLRMLSIGFLLNLKNEDFKILVTKIDADNVSDKLFEFIIKNRITDRLKKIKENYDQDKSEILKVYDKLRSSIEVNNRLESIEQIAKYLEKNFNHKNSGFYNSHKSRASVYYGYWSFESAAIVSILGLDDTDLRNIQYYPKDLVDYYREQKNITPNKA